MNIAHLHLIVNHLPIVGLGFAQLFNLLALFRKSDELARFTCWCYVLIAVLVVPSILTGGDIRHPEIRQGIFPNP